MNASKVYRYVSEGRKLRFCTPNVRTKSLGGEVPTPLNRRCSPVQKWCKCFFNILLVCHTLPSFKICKLLFCFQCCLLSFGLVGWSLLPVKKYLSEYSYIKKLLLWALQFLWCKWFFKILWVFGYEVLRVYCKLCPVRNSPALRCACCCSHYR